MMDDTPSADGAAIDAPLPPASVPSFFVEDDYPAPGTFPAPSMESIIHDDT